MRFASAADALVLKRAALGPAAMALRSARFAGRVPRARASLARGGSFGRCAPLAGAAPPYYHGSCGPQNMLGTLGDAAVNQTATKVAAVGTQSGVTWATAASAGAWAGPIGIAAGAIVGLVLGKILNRQYLNVGQANAIADASLQAFQQYRQIAGQVPGRQLGVDAMNAIWNGAIYSGLFPGNNQQLCFHEGCLKYRGQPAWVWGTFHDGANNPFTFAAAWARMRTAAPAPTIPSGIATVQPVPAYRGGGFMQRLVGFRGLGSLGDLLPGTPDAVTLIDQYFIPASRNDRPPWAVPQTALEHQILYDAADAWLQVNGDSGSTPFVAVANTLPANVGPTITAGDPTQGAVNPLGPGPGGSGVTGASPVGAGGNTYAFTPVTNPVTGQTTYEITAPHGPVAPGTLTVAAGAPGVLTAGLSNIPLWGYALVAAGIIFAMARPESAMRRQRSAVREKMS